MRRQQARVVYEFAPGQEMQHDTSPHRAWIGGVLRDVDTAAVVLCYPQMLYFQMVPRFTRFECKIVLTEACEYFGGSADDWMIDNTHVARCDCAANPVDVCGGQRRQEVKARRAVFVGRADAVDCGAMDGNVQSSVLGLAIPSCSARMPKERSSAWAETPSATTWAVGARCRRAASVRAPS
jgi:hypothetical protein